MSETVTLSLEQAQEIAAKALEAANTSPENARITAKALVAAEIDGQAGHGLSRVVTYAEQARTGKADGHARPSMTRIRPGLIRVDAAHGFAYPAFDMAIDALSDIAAEQGVAAAAVFRSHHFGQAGAHCERLAERGFAAFVFGNSPKAMAPWGTAKALLGTNPIAFAAPLPNAPPLVIDLALSRVARGKVVAKSQLDEPIPEGWALDAQGAPTTDAHAALKGTMVPIGEAKGAALALMVEIMAACLAGAHLAFEASSLFDGEGPPPNLGQSILALDAGALSAGGFAARMTDLLAAYEEAGARLPGTRRLENRARAQKEGLAIPQALHDKIMNLVSAGRDDSDKSQ